MQSDIARAASAFIWLVVEGAGSRSLRDAAVALYPDEIAAVGLAGRLRYLLFVAVAVLCDLASLPLAGEPPASTASDGLSTAHVMRSAQRLISAIQRAPRQELAAAHAYLQAPPPDCGFAAERPLLAKLGFGVACFMIECALAWPDYARSSLARSVPGWRDLDPASPCSASAPTTFTSPCRNAARMRNARRNG